MRMDSYTKKEMIQDFKEIKEEIEEKIQQPIELELTLGVKLFD